MNKVLREEKKFLISTAEYLQKSCQLEKVLLQDPHNGTHGYPIRSLYFDTPFDDDFFEKQAGTEIRKKIRLRCYDPHHNYAMLELKQKQGQRQMKRSLRISKEDALRLVACDYSPLLSYQEEFAGEMYGLMRSRCYRPKTIVQYNRKAFIAKENRIRITFDNTILSTESSFDLFSDSLNMNPVLDPYDVIMEVKFNGFLLGYIQQLINSIDKSELSVSKYCLARQHAYQTHI
ncbi:MAG: polyphosphate polymerase domain-containing protein [Eubacteriales bacterium]|nr:polyphosphate polymerase domain-containing protein [Eubacteriales bacterium]